MVSDLAITDEWLKEKMEILNSMLGYLFENEVIIEDVHSHNPKEFSDYYRIINSFTSYPYCNLVKYELLECDDDMVIDEFWNIIYYVQEQRESQKS